MELHVAEIIIILLDVVKQHVRFIFYYLLLIKTNYLANFEGNGCVKCRIIETQDIYPLKIYRNEKN